MSDSQTDSVAERHIEDQARATITNVLSGRVGRQTVHDLGRAVEVAKSATAVNRAIGAGAQRHSD